MYRAQARLLIEDERAARTDFRTSDSYVQDAYWEDPEPYHQTQYKILKSRVLARKIVKTLELDKVTEFNGGVQSSGVAKALGWLGEGVQSMVLAMRDSATSAEPPVTKETTAESAQITMFLSHLRVEPVRKTRLVDLSFDAGEPEFAARAANAVVDAYVRQNLEAKLENTNNTLAWLAEELIRQQNKVEAAEQALSRYREQQDALSLEDRQNIVVARLNQFNDAVTRAKTNRVQKEAAYSQLRTPGNKTESFPGILQNPYIQQLKTRLSELKRERARLSEKYGDKHPDIVKADAGIRDANQQIESEIAKVVSSVGSEYRSALAEERTLVAALEDQKGAAMDLNRKSVAYTVLDREAKSNRQVYEALLQRENELRVVSNSKANNARVIDYAEPPKEPFSPRSVRDMLLAILAGSLLSIATAFGLEYLDDTVKTPDDVTGKLKLPLLGLVPRVEQNASVLLSESAPFEFAEAFKALRTSLVLSSTHERTQTILVTSAVPLEGKTTTACNIAMALGLGSARVLLIDADMRRPSLHTRLRCPNDVGLSTLLTGDASVASAIQPLSIRNGLLTAGPSPANPSELLASERMARFLNALEGLFDWIIIDTPPILVVTDAVVL
ncbi:MAG: GumC family protein, partial [Acidimicrobiia bacterium]